MFCTNQCTGAPHVFLYKCFVSAQKLQIDTVSWFGMQTCLRERPVVTGTLGKLRDLLDLLHRKWFRCFLVETKPSSNSVIPQTEQMEIKLIKGEKKLTEAPLPGS